MPGQELAPYRDDPGGIGADATDVLPGNLVRGTAQAIAEPIDLRLVQRDQHPVPGLQGTEDDRRHAVHEVVGARVRERLVAEASRVRRTRGRHPATPFGAGPESWSRRWCQNR